MILSLLSETPLFKGLTPDKIEIILKSVHYRIRKYGTGALIAQSGEPVNALMIVMTGVVKGEMVDYSGRIIKIEDIPAPEALAAAFIFGNRNRFPVNVVTVSDAEILVIDKNEFLILLKGNDEILVNFMDMISNRSQFLTEKIKFLNFKTIKSKLAQYILKLAGDQKYEIKLDRTQNDLADYFGVARPSIARVLKEMEEEGLMKVTGKKILIIDKKGLLDLTRE